MMNLISKFQSLFSKGYDLVSAKNILIQETDCNETELRNEIISFSDERTKPNGNYKRVCDGRKVTIYFRNEFMGSIIKVEAKLHGYGRTKYAQYNNAPFVEYIKKRTRTKRVHFEGYKPYMLILEGWNNPEPESMWGEKKDLGNGMISQRSKYSCCSDGWENDFDKLIQKHIDSGDVEVVRDWRKG